VRAIEYIVEHYKSKITVRELASVANMSESNFYAIFKKHRGISPIAFLNNYRLSIAADKLVETNASISEIGYLVGIGDSLYFSKLFKKTYGVSPKEYRVMYKKKNG
jgi:AraC-like DNA-binding protein